MPQKKTPHEKFGVEVWGWDADHRHSLSLKSLSGDAPTWAADCHSLAATKLAGRSLLQSGSVIV